MKPQHRDLLDERAWNGTDAANDPPDDDDWGEILGWGSFMSEFTEYPGDVNPDVGPDPPLYGASWDQRGQEHPIPWHEEDYGGVAEAGELEYPGWGDSGFWSPLEHGVEDDAEDVFPEGWEGEDVRVDYARRLQQNHAVPKGIELPRNTWGFWGQEGPRIFDETCYMRHEEVMPVKARPYN